MRKLSLVSKLQIASVIFFAAVYSLLSLVNHYNFRTYAYDLGVQNNALYDYAHLHFNRCTLLQPALNNYLSEHFEVFVMLLSPFSYLFGTCTLLIFQILFVLFGGFGVYRYIEVLQEGRERGWLPFLAQLHFYFFYGIFSALNYDFHNNVLGAMFVPWFFYFFHLRRGKAATLVFAFMILTKENMPLWMGFICAGTGLLYWKNKAQRIASFGYSAFALAFFVFIVQVIMPSLANHGEAYVQIRNNYSALGSTLPEILSAVVLNPGHSVGLLFFNPTNNVHADYCKFETWLYVLLSGGILFLFRPQFMLMLVPVFAQKMFHNDYLKWGIGDHYSVEFAPICSIGAFYVLSNLRKEETKKWAGVLVALFSLIISIRSFDRSFTYFDRDRHRVYQARHYRKDYDVAEAYRALALVPDGAKVSAQSPFVPHLAFRDGIYQFPVLDSAQYVVVSTAENPYPLTRGSFNVQVAMLESSKDWEKIYDRNQMLIFKRASNSGSLVK